MRCAVASPGVLIAAALIAVRCGDSNDEPEPEPEPDGGDAARADTEEREDALDLPEGVFDDIPRGSDVPPGECAYVDIAGTCTVTSVGVGAPTDAIVTVDFTPDDPSAVERYLWPDWGDTEIAFRPLDFPDQETPEVGSVWACTRSEITAGTCTPVTFQIDGPP